MTAPAPTPVPVPSFVRPVVGLLAGLGIVALVVFTGTLVVTLAVLPGADPRQFQPTPGYLMVKLALNVAGAFAGGFTTSRITFGRSFFTVGLLALMLLVSGVAQMMRDDAPQPGSPSWYPLALALLAPVGVLAGGALERRKPTRGIAPA